MRLTIMSNKILQYASEYHERTAAREWLRGERIVQLGGGRYSTTSGGVEYDAAASEWAEYRAQWENAAWEKRDGCCILSFNEAGLRTPFFEEVDKLEVDVNKLIKNFKNRIIKFLKNQPTTLNLSTPMMKAAIWELGSDALVKLDRDVDADSDSDSDSDSSEEHIGKYVQAGGIACTCSQKDHMTIALRPNIIWNQETAAMLKKQYRTVLTLQQNFKDYTYGMDLLSTDEFHNKFYDNLNLRGRRGVGLPRDKDEDEYMNRRMAPAPPGYDDMPLTEAQFNAAFGEDGAAKWDAAIGTRYYVDEDKTVSAVPGPSK